MGQVDYAATPEELLAHFEACGTVERVTIVCDKYSGKPKGKNVVDDDVCVRREEASLHVREYIINLPYLLCCRICILGVCGKHQEATDSDMLMIGSRAVGLILKIPMKKPAQAPSVGGAGFCILTFACLFFCRCLFSFILPRLSKQWTMP